MAKMNDKKSHTMKRMMFLLIFLLSGKMMTGQPVELVVNAGNTGDVVHLATYAPLLAHIDAWQWNPDLIWFDRWQSFNIYRINY